MAAVSAPAPLHSPPPSNDWPRLDPRHSLRARAALVFAGAALLITGTAAWLAGHLLDTEWQQRLGGGLESVAAQIGSTLERSVYERYEDLQFVAKNAASRTPAERAELRPFVDALLDTSSDFAWIGVADTEGAINVGAQRLFEGARLSDQLWFRRGQSQVYVGLPHANAELTRAMAAAEQPDSRVFEIAVPLTGANGTFAGVAAASVRWSIADDIAHTAVTEALRSEHVGVTIYGGTGESLYDSGATGWTEPPEAPAFAPGRLRAYLVEHTSDGATFLTGYARTRGYRDFRGLGLVVAVRQPLANALAPVAAFRRTIWITGLLLTALFGAAGWWLATPVSRELRRITAASSRIQAGDTLAILPAPVGHGELARACAALRGLIEHLRGRNDPGQS